MSMYDGYPWHEFYINGLEFFRHDPFETNEGPSSLFGDGEHSLPYNSDEWYPLTN